MLNYFRSVNRRQILFLTLKAHFFPNDQCENCVIELSTYSFYYLVADIFNDVTALMLLTTQNSLDKSKTREIRVICGRN